jgi:serine/threonine protein kinase
VAKNLIQRLLGKSPEQRLQREAVKEHEWFRPKRFCFIDWEALYAPKARLLGPYHPVSPMLNDDIAQEGAPFQHWGLPDADAWLQGLCLVFCPDIAVLLSPGLFSIL